MIYIQEEVDYDDEKNENDVDENVCISINLLDHVYPSYKNNMPLDSSNLGAHLALDN